MRILFVTGNRIGDCVLSTGILGWMVDNLPKARFTVVCGPEAAPLFEGVPRIERVIAMRKRPWGLHWWDLWKQIVGTGWHTLIDLRGSLIGQGIVARRRVVQRTPGSGRIHQVVHLSGLLKLRAPPAPRAFLTDAQRAAAATLLPADGPVLALGPGAGWPAKRWPPERFARLAARLTAEDGILPGARVMVVGADEAALARSALADLPADCRIDLTGRIDAGVAQACLARASLFVGNDSGPMHMAAAAGTPTLGLFGPSRDDRYGPWGDHCRSLRTPESYGALIRNLSGPHPMDGLGVEAVALAAEALWQELKED